MSFKILFLFCTIEVRESSFGRIIRVRLFFQKFLIKSLTLSNVLRRDVIVNDLPGQANCLQHCTQGLRLLKFLLLLLDGNEFSSCNVTRRRGRVQYLRKIGPALGTFGYRVNSRRSRLLSVPCFTSRLGSLRWRFLSRAVISSDLLRSA